MTRRRKLASAVAYLDEFVTEVLIDLSEVDRWSYRWDEERGQLYVVDMYHGTRYAGSYTELDH
jgi:hypothetical protein